SSMALGASLVVNWQDNSTNEDGFKIERGVSGSYAEIGSVGPDIRSYTDSSVIAGTTYCYRVRAFNSSGVSSPSNESCPSIPIGIFALALTKSGAGSGSVTSNPAGINCGSDCSEVYSSGTIGFSYCDPGRRVDIRRVERRLRLFRRKVTITANKTCTATFSLNPAGYVLTVNITSGVSNGGIGSVTIT